MYLLCFPGVSVFRVRRLHTHTRWTWPCCLHVRAQPAPGAGARPASVRVPAPPTAPARTRHAAFLGGCGSPAWVGEPAFDLQTQLPRLTCAVLFNMLRSATQPRTWLLGSPKDNSEAPIPQGHGTHLAGKMLRRETNGNTLYGQTLHNVFNENKTRKMV